MTSQGYPCVLVHFVGPLPVVLCALPEPTDAEIAHDLRQLSDRAETPYEKSTAIQTGDTFAMRQRMLRNAARTRLGIET
jgi:hypothetical protein